MLDFKMLSLSFEKLIFIDSILQGLLLFVFHAHLVNLREDFFKPLKNILKGWPS